MVAVLFTLWLLQVDFGAHAQAVVGLIILPCLVFSCGTSAINMLNLTGFPLILESREICRTIFQASKQLRSWKVLEK